MERTAIINLATDLTRGHVAGNYAAGESSEVLRQALIEANGGSTKVDLKSLRRNKAEIFDLLEAIMPVVVAEGLKGDEFFMNYVDDREVAAGDSLTFVAEDQTNFIVSEIADGIARPRRQRIDQKTSVTVPTTWHAVRVYDEWSRFMAGRIDWNELVDRVSRSFRNAIYEDIYAAMSGITASTPGLNSTYVVSGSYSEESLLAIVDHVEAATGMKAVIVGTRPALRKCTSAVVADEAKTAYYNGGYYGKLAGVDMVAVKNVHKPGTDTFVFSDSVLYVLATGDKPIKFVREGDPWIEERTEGNADKTMEYTYQEKFGVGLLINGKLGKYTISA